MQFTAARIATIAALAWSATTAIAQTVTPPPLPPGHDLVKPDVGLNEDERKRYVRAHHHKMHNKKDVTRDDTDDHDDRRGNDDNRGDDRRDASSNNSKKK
jgi:hypothetical protein